MKGEGGCLVFYKSTLKASMVTSPTKSQLFEALEMNFAFNEGYYHIIMILPYHHARPTTPRAGFRILLMEGTSPLLRCPKGTACWEGSGGMPPPLRNLENYSSKFAIWRHLGIKLPFNSWFKVVIVMLLQIKFKEKKGKYIQTINTLTGLVSP